MKNYLMVSVFLFSFVANAQQVTKQLALTVAKNFYSEKTQNSLKNQGIANQNFKLNKTIQAKLKNLYVFNTADKQSFIIVSANKKTYPVLAYSLANSFPEQNMPPEVMEWLENYDVQIAKIKTLKSSAFLKSTKAWSKYSDENFQATNNTLKETVLTDVPVLLSTTWNQGNYYNALCPECSSGGSGGHVWAGCVATAMAQLMKYWDYPSTGQGEHTYTHSVYGIQSADFQNTTYDWASMPNAVSSPNIDVATLLYHCGVAVNMDYSPTGSGAYSSTARSSLIRYFKYSSNTLLTSRYNYTDERWKRLLRAELDAGRPMYYSGYGSGGHAFNLDAYQGTDYFHLNWGWGGAYNGYFYMDDLTPGGHDYSNSNSAIVGAVPNTMELHFDSTSVIELTNQVPYAGTTTDGFNNANLYEKISWHETGKEKLHKITTATAGRITATISGLSENLDVFILKYANRLSTLAYGDSTAILDDAEPGTYYVVVDGRYASESDYTLTISCPDSRADLIVENAKIEPQYIQEGQSFRANCNIRNIGNSDAAANMLKFYVSDNQTLSNDDLLIDSLTVDALVQKTGIDTSSILVLPDGYAPGMQYIIFDIDANNDIDETDDVLNQTSANFTIPAAGLMDCSTAVTLTDNELYSGNASLQGDSVINDYLWFTGLTNKEVIHKFTAEYTGLVNLEFSESLEGNTKLLLLAGCNENSMLNSYEIWNPEDTVLKEKFRVTGGLDYYLVIDGNNDTGNSEGAYSIRINLPKECPVPVITGLNVDLCEGDHAAYIYTDWAYSNYQWLKDGVEITDAVSSGYSAPETGLYTVKITENGCTGTSEGVQVSYSPKPPLPEISALSDTTFCEGGSVELHLNTGTGFTYQWTNNDIAVAGADSFYFETGIGGSYRAEVTNLSCTVKSNPINVSVWHSAKENGEPLDMSTDSLVSYWPFDQWGTDESGNNNYAGIYASQTKDRNKHMSAFSFNGVDNYIYTSKQFAHLDTFTVSLWFKTSGSGKLIGFNEQQYAQADTLFDRHIYIGSTGHINFGIETSGKQVISTTTPYNDNVWHMVSASLSPNGMKLYVDAELVAQNNSVISGGNYAGYWKMAFGSLENWPDDPGNNYFEGKLDDIRIYNRELNLDEIEVLYTAQKINIYLETPIICASSGNTNIIIENSEPDIEYQLIKVPDNIPVGASLAGNAATINLPTGNLTETTSFKIKAVNSNTLCPRLLDSVFTITVNESPIPEVTINSNKQNNEICTGDSIVFSSTIQHGGSSPIYQWLQNGVAIGQDSNIYTSNTLSDGDVVKLQLSSSIECASPKTVTSDAIIVKVNNLPDNSLTLSGSKSICAGDSSKLSANTDVTFEWYQIGNGLLSIEKSIWINNSGAYFLRLENASGCISYSDTVEFELFTLPVVDLGPDTSIFGNQVVTLETKGNFNSYLWNTGATSESITVDGSYNLGEHEFWLQVNDDNCANSDTIIINIKQVTGVDKLFVPSTIKLYPNPATESIEFSLSYIYPEDLLVQLRDIYGKLIWSKNYEKQANLLKETITLKNYSPGLYFLNFIVDKNKVSKKFVIR